MLLPRKTNKIPVVLSSAKPSPSFQHHTFSHSTIPITIWETQFTDGSREERWGFLCCSIWARVCPYRTPPLQDTDNKNLSEEPKMKPLLPFYYDDLMLIQNTLRTRLKMCYNSFTFFDPEENKRLKQAYLEKGLSDGIFTLVSY